ncbi:MAG TPA: hypothetical protein VJJ21_00315 [Candidatus Nanoarchaeia archaeon]|nr:hypothetical protein [Candidatus Nanoarchaeia archaeon]
MAKGNQQFNWIFVLIAGSIFLIFFITVAVKYKSLQEEKTSIELLNNLDIAITSLQSSPFQTTSELTFPLETAFSCNKKITITIGNKQYQTENIISAGKIKGSAIIMSKNINLPFKISTVYYILPESANYVFVYDKDSEELISTIKQDLSLLKNINYEKYPVEENKNYQYIYFLPIKNKISVSKTSISYPDKESLPYYGSPQLYSFIFSQQPDCISSLLNEKLESKTQLYKNKLSLLQSDKCDYTLINSKLQELPGNPSIENQQSIIEINKQLINQNCPAVF